MKTLQAYLRPDTVLSIYYIEGIVPRSARLKMETFIGNWVEDDFSFLFFTAPARKEVEKICDNLPGLKLLDEFEMTYEQWQGGTIEPVRIGRFLLNPPWIKATPAENEIALTIDSGVVFGNGTHPTTRACLEAIDIACTGGKVQTMLDLGCGTGILALAAGRLGCSKAIAVDYNLLACKTALSNVHLNDLRKNIVVVNGRAEQFTARATDLLVANIHYEVMKKVIRTDGFLRQKWFVLSGLLRSEEKKVSAYLATRPVLIVKRWSEDNIWHTMLGITREEST
ncbi:50S ribosomal protein L11 methyltransferase [Desulfomarina sp.]